MGYMIDDVVGLNLRKIRLERKLTQGALADMAHISKQSISNIETGAGGSSKTLSRLAECLEVSPLAFYQDDGLDTSIRFKRVTAQKPYLDRTAYTSKLGQAVDFIYRDCQERVFFIMAMTLKETISQNSDMILESLNAERSAKNHHTLSEMADDLTQCVKQAVFGDSEDDLDELDELAEGDDSSGT